MTAGTDGAGGEAPANTVQVGGWTLSADLSPEAMAQVQGLISGMQNDAGPARQAVERPDGSIEFPEQSDDDKAAADAAFAQLVAQHPGARACPGVYAVPPDASCATPSNVRRKANRRRTRASPRLEGSRIATAEIESGASPARPRSQLVSSYGFSSPPIRLRRRLCAHL